jgi:HK97 family phage major capsid protein
MEQTLESERAQLLRQVEEIHRAIQIGERPMTKEERAIFYAATDRIEVIDATQKGQKNMNDSLYYNPPVKGDPEHSIKVGADRDLGAPGGFGRYLGAVRNAALGRASDADRREIESRAIAGAGETPASAGGFLVEKPIADKILDFATKTSVLTSLVQTIPVERGGVKLPVVDTSSDADASRPLRGYWLAEGETITTKVPAWKQETYDVKILAILAPVTDSLLEDAPALEGWMTQAAGREMGYCLDRAIYRGSGTGCPLGALNAPCLVSVAAEGAQDADTILSENVIKMRARVLPGFNYTWVYSPSALEQLVNLTHPTSGMPLWLPRGSNSYASAVNDSILGFPAMEFAHCSPLGDQGDVMLGAWGEYILAQQGSLRSDTSIHVYFDTIQTAFRFVVRVDGQPGLPAPCAPEQTPSLTLSHFVTLDERA